MVRCPGTANNQPMPNQNLPFDQRACFIGGPAKSGTTLLRALLDSHPELLALPQDTDYFSTVLTKYGASGRRAQFDYLTKVSYAKILFGGQARPDKHDYSDFPQRDFSEIFERTAFEPANAGRDLLVLLMEAYARVLRVPLDSVKRWVEKTPANRNYIPQIFARFPHAKLLVTMRDPRALLASQIALKKRVSSRRFSVYYVVDHWRTSAQLALRVRRGEIPGLVVQYEELVLNPGAMMGKICQHLEVGFDPNAALRPTKVGQLWAGNSAEGVRFSEISREPASRWEHDLSKDEIGWIEWHCRDLMPEFGYQPRLRRRALRHWLKPVRGEDAHEFFKSRFYSICDVVSR
jgi:hypothetical protein